MDNHCIVVEGLLSDIGLTRYVRCTLKCHSGGVLVTLTEIGQTYVEQGVLCHGIVRSGYLREVFYGSIHITGLEL